jgi:hypothetical protein
MIRRYTSGEECPATTTPSHAVDALASRRWSSPVFIDSMTDTLCAAYHAHPERLYVLHRPAAGEETRIVYQGAEGPFLRDEQNHGAGDWRTDGMGRERAVNAQNPSRHLEGSSPPDRKSFLTFRTPFSNPFLVLSLPLFSLQYFFIFLLFILHIRRHHPHVPCISCPRPPSFPRFEAASPFHLGLQLRRLQERPWSERNMLLAEWQEQRGRSHGGGTAQVASCLGLHALANSSKIHSFVLGLNFHMK